MAKRVIDGELITYKSPEEFLSLEEVPKGRFTVEYNGLPIDFEYENRGFSTTAIFFHAAIGPSIKNLPLFLGKGFSRDVSVNRLFVSDPSLYVDERLRLAWYAGSSVQPQLQEKLSSIFIKVVGNRRAIYSGASGGGYASLVYSAMHPESLALPVNPQTVIANYPRPLVCEWTNLAWGMENGRTGDLQFPPAVVDLTTLYNVPRDNHVAYIQNSGDTSHVEKQWKPFSENCHPDNSLILVFDFAGEGHVAPRNVYLTELLNIAADCKSWADLKFDSVVTSPLRV